MRNLVPTLIAAMLTSFAIVSVAPQASAAPKAGSVYATKKAECTRKADLKKWGIHRIQRSNWINDCIAGG
jgi:hypothetical protein